MSNQLIYYNRIYSYSNKFNCHTHIYHKQKHYSLLLCNKIVIYFFHKSELLLKIEKNLDILYLSRNYYSNKNHKSSFIMSILISFQNS